VSEGARWDYALDVDEVVGGFYCFDVLFGAAVQSLLILAVFLHSWLQVLIRDFAVGGASGLGGVAD
jgi:hypothetical protein